MKHSLIFTIVIFLNACCGPMECKEAEVGFGIYKPLINGIEKYKEKYYKYPKNINELIPEFLSTIPRHGSEYRASNVSYIKEDDSFLLKFSYEAPGVNICIFKSKANNWSCYGAY